MAALVPTLEPVPVEFNMIKLKIRSCQNKVEARKMTRNRASLIISNY